MYIDAGDWLQEMRNREIEESSRALFADTEELMEEGPGKYRWEHPTKIIHCPVCGAKEEVVETAKICKSPSCVKHKDNLNSDNMPKRKRTHRLLQLWREGKTFQEIYEAGGYSSPGAIQAAITKSIDATYKRALEENKLMDIRKKNGLKGNLPSVL